MIDEENQWKANDATIADSGRQCDMSEDARIILSACIRGVDVTEIYSPIRINQVCHEFGLRMGVIR